MLFIMVEGFMTIFKKNEIILKNILMILFFFGYFINVLPIADEIIVYYKYFINFLSCIYALLIIFINRRMLSKDIIYIYSFIFFITLSTLLSKNNHRLTVLFDLLNMIMFMITFYYCNDKKTFRLTEMFMFIEIMYTLIITSLSFFLLLIRHSITKGNSFIIAGRIAGLYPGLTAVGMFCIMSICFSLYFLSKPRVKVKCTFIVNCFLIINIVLQTIMVVFSDNRAGLICVFIIHYYLLYKYLPIKFQKKAKRVLLAFILALVVFVIVTNIGEIIISAFGLNDSLVVGNRESAIVSYDLNYLIKSYPDYEVMRGLPEIWVYLSVVSSDRIVIWYSSILEIIKKPLLGYGISSSGYAFHIFRNYANTHNLFINILLFGGFASLIPFIMLSFLWLKKCIFNSFLQREWLVIFLLCSLIFSMLDIAVLFSTNMITFFFWLIIGCIMYE